MEEVYSAADLAIARAGAASLAELAAFSLPLVLIPFPYAADDHQTRNAEIFTRAEAAVMLREAELSGDLLARKIQELIADPNRLLRMAENCGAPRAEKRGRTGRGNDGEIYPNSMTLALEADLQKRLTRERHRIHLIGVAGSGMSGIAALLLELGHQVSGSDKRGHAGNRSPAAAGLALPRAARGRGRGDAELVIYSSAIKEDNPILASARLTGTPTARRAEALAAIMLGKRGIVIAGMHGKTTTSAMAAHVFREGGMHPSHYVGAEIPMLGTNAHWDPRGEYFVAEGDESDGTLRFFHPEHALMLNIEEEHLDFYADLAAIEAVYRQLLDQTTGSRSVLRRRCECDTSVCRPSSRDFFRVRGERRLPRDRY